LGDLLIPTSSSLTLLLPPTSRQIPVDDSSIQVSKDRWNRIPHCQEPKHEFLNSDFTPHNVTKRQLNLTQLVLSYQNIIDVSANKQNYFAQPCTLNKLLETGGNLT